LLPGSRKSGFGRFRCSLRLLVGRACPLGILPRAVAGQRQAAITQRVFTGERSSGGLGREVRLGLSDHLLLQNVLGFEPSESRLPLVGDCLRAIERGAISRNSGWFEPGKSLEETR